MALNWNALNRLYQFKQTHFHKKYFKFDSWNIVSFQKCFTKKYLKIIFLLLNRSWEKNQNDFLIWNKGVKQNTCQRLHFQINLKQTWGIKILDILVTKWSTLQRKKGFLHGFIRCSPKLHLQDLWALCSIVNFSTLSIHYSYIFWHLSWAWFQPMLWV